MTAATSSEKGRASASPKRAKLHCPPALLPTTRPTTSGRRSSHATCAVVEQSPYALTGGTDPSEILQQAAKSETVL